MSQSLTSRLGPSEKYQQATAVFAEAAVAYMGNRYTYHSLTLPRESFDKMVAAYQKAADIVDAAIEKEFRA